MNKYIPIGLLVLGVSSALGGVAAITHAQSLADQKPSIPAIMSMAEGLRLSYERGLGDTTRARVEREKILASSEYDSAKTAYEQALTQKDSANGFAHIAEGLFGLTLLCAGGAYFTSRKT